MAQSFDETAVAADESNASATANETTPETQDEAREPSDIELYPDDPGKTELGDEEPADEGDDQDPEVNDEQPEIEAPRSWTAEEKKLFSELPRAAQEAVSRRVTEVDRFAEAKAREAQDARQSAQREALTVVKQIAEANETALKQTLPPIIDRPSNQLMVEDPVAFANQMDAHERSVAQYQEVQQRIEWAKQQAGEAEQMLRGYTQQKFHEVLSTEYPEFLDQSETGAKLRTELGSIALELGFPAEVLPDVDHVDVLALKKVSDWKVKAGKWDAFNKDKMAAVRGAKDLPRIAKPGAGGGSANRASQSIEAQLYPDDVK